MRLLALSLALSLLPVWAAASQTDRTPLPPGVDIVPREAWGGAAPVLPMILQTPRALTIHHSGALMNADRDPSETVRALYAFSISSDTLGDGRPKKPWADIPYHFYIAPDGSILEARDVAFLGDTNTRYDLSGQVQVVVEGNFDEEEPTGAQMASLLALSAALAEQWGFGPGTVAGHGDRAPEQTVCPGDALEARFPEVRDAVRASALRALEGTWSVKLRASPDAEPYLQPFVVRIGDDGALSGSFYGSEILDGRATADGDALRFALTTRDAGGAYQTQGRVVGGRLEGTTYAPHRDLLSVWTAVRAE